MRQSSIAQLPRLFGPKVEAPSAAMAHRLELAQELHTETAVQNAQNRIGLAIAEHQREFRHVKSSRY